MAPLRLKVLSLNIHKGFSATQKFILPELKDALRESGADLVLLQEVLGRHEGHAQKILDWPSSAQAEYLADQIWKDHAYGRNAIYEMGDHGNAILSKWELTSRQNTDISPNSFDRRGFLSATLSVQGVTIWVVSLHLSLLANQRADQLERLSDFVKEHVPPMSPLLIGGDFNDWQGDAGRIFAKDLHLDEVCRNVDGAEARTFPSFLPVLRLDRIYTRGFKIATAVALNSPPWSRLSDHLPLLTEIELDE